MAKAKKTAKKKVKRYSASEKKEILDFITKKGRGGQTKAVAKFGVTAATIASWRLKDGGSGVKTAKGASKELRAVEELASLIKEISTVEARLEKLKKAYQKFKLGDFEFLFSATKYSHPIERSFQIQKGKIKMSHIKNFNKRTQDFSPSYYDVGQFYWGKVNSWLNNEIIFNKNSAIHLIPKDKVQDIDTLDDWKFAEKLYSIKK